MTAMPALTKGRRDYPVRSISFATPTKLIRGKRRKGKRKEQTRPTGQGQPEERNVYSDVEVEIIKYARKCKMQERERREGKG